MKTLKSSTRHLAIPLFLFSWLAGCGDPLVPPQTITDLRVIGAKLSAIAEPERAQLLPGEEGSLSWLIVDQRNRSFETTTIWCRATSGTLGPPECAEQPFDTQQYEGDSTSALELTFTLPESASPGEDWLALLGVCSKSRAVFQSRTNDFRCEGGERVRLAHYRSTIAESAGDANRNPSLSDDALRFDGSLWTPTAEGSETDPESDEPCLSSWPVARRGKSYQLSFKLEGDDREDLEQSRYGVLPRESLVYSHLTTHAELERPYSLIAYDQDSLNWTTAFTPESALELPSDGEEGRLYLVVRDERGGLDWTQYNYCATR